MAELHYARYLEKVRGCIMGLGDMTWIEPALRVVAAQGVDFTGLALAKAYEQAGALTPHFLRNMDRGIYPPLAVFDDPQASGAGGMDCAPLWACICPGDPTRAMEYAARDASVDHQGEAVEAAKFLAAAMSLAFVKTGAASCLEGAMGYLHEDSRIAKLVHDACQLQRDNPAQARARLDWRYGGVDGSLMPQLVNTISSLLLQDQDDRLAAAFKGILEGCPSTSDVGDAVAVRVSRAGIACMEMVKRRGGTLPLTITAAPPVATEPRSPGALSCITVAFMGAPVLQPGHARQCILQIENNGDQALEGAIDCTASGCMQAMTASHTKVAPGETARVPFTIWLPENAPTITESNVMTVRFAGLEHTFGIAGAQGYRVCGTLGVVQQSVFKGRSLPHNPMWEPYFAQGNRIELDSINGWIGPCSFVLERQLVIGEPIEVEVEVARTCPFVMEMDGEVLMSGEGTDGWTIARQQQMLLLACGTHTLRLYLDRSAPGGSIEVDWIDGGRMASLEAVNPLIEA